MTPGAAAEAIEIEVHLRADGGLTMARDIRLGLTAKPKELAPKYFYDERGSRLFERITELEEYYPTRAEREILVHRSAEIVAAAGEPGTLVELGSGSATKTRHLLSAMRDAGCLATYVPVDISEEITRDTAEALVEEYPGLVIRGLPRCPPRIPDPDCRPARAWGPGPARHRPGQGRGPPRGRLRRLPGRHGRIQQERPQRAQPHVRRRLRPRRLPPRRPL
jgi:histidine-specific SAM-dependent methyltransferase